MKIKLSITLLLIFKLSIGQVFTVSSTETEVQQTTNYELCGNYIIEMDNGKTILINSKYKRESFFINIFDNQHALQKPIIFKLNDFKNIDYNFKFLYCHESNGKGVFYYYVEGEVTELYKLEINPETGEITNKKILEFTTLNLSNLIFKMLVSKDKTKYALIYSETKQDEVNLNFKFFNSSTNQLISQSSKVLNDCYRLTLLDAIMDNTDIYLCLNKKLKPAPNKYQGPFKPPIEYLPENKVLVLKSNIESKNHDIYKLNLPPFNYFTKAQLGFNFNNKQVNLLLNVINPKDDYGKEADSKTMFYQFSTSEFNLVSENNLNNDYAIKNVKIKYPLYNYDVNTFANFPQHMYTDSMGNNTFIFQSVHNQYNSKDSYCDILSSDFAIEYSNSNLDFNAITFSPYAFAIPTVLYEPLRQFAFRCNTSGYSSLIFKNFQNDFTTFEVNDKIVMLYNLSPKNIGKTIGDEYKYSREKDNKVPMILIVNKNYHSINRVFSESEEFKKFVFNIDIMSYNKNTKTCCIAANEISGNKERLVWIKFK